jgi:hypothetical protein
MGAHVKASGCCPSRCALLAAAGESVRRRIDGFEPGPNPESKSTKLATSPSDSKEEESKPGLAQETMTSLWTVVVDYVSRSVDSKS